MTEVHTAMKSGRLYVDIENISKIDLEGLSTGLFKQLADLSAA